ncbi:hypothetical protein [Cellvibrio mixtus]|uniref:hypothetical protein n=1 Tax=Cellvibrio mixtus TaxID=39650 RepID=UPI00058802E0|nr:hypothetical protein [Cellvibrio mixtus]
MKYDKDYILDNIEMLLLDDDFMLNVNSYLTEAIENLDLNYAKLLLISGANPNINTNAQFSIRNHGFLHDLIHRYHVEKISKGDLIENAVHLLLSFGANPDCPGDSNAAPIQRCTGKSGNIEKILLEFGANRAGNVIY